MVDKSHTWTLEICEIIWRSALYRGTFVFCLPRSQARVRADPLHV